MADSHFMVCFLWRESLRQDIYDLKEAGTCNSSHCLGFGGFVVVLDFGTGGEGLRRLAG